MMGKQIITDIIVIILFPALLIGGYYYFSSSDGALLSFVSPSATNGGADPDLGVKTANALSLLRTIPSELDQSLFSDPAYLMLKDYQVTIPTIALGRTYPFTPPPVLENITRSSKFSAPSVKTVAPPLLTPAEKLDLLKKAGF